VAGFFVAEDKQGPIVDDAIGLEACEAFVDVPDQVLVVAKYPKKEGVNLGLPSRIGSSSPHSLATQALARTLADFGVTTTPVRKPSSSYGDIAVFGVRGEAR
jgi:hypothetical protein